MSTIAEYASWERGCRIADAIEYANYNERGWIRAPYYFPIPKAQHVQLVQSNKSYATFADLSYEPKEISKKFDYHLGRHNFKALRKTIRLASAAEFAELCSCEFARDKIRYKMIDLSKYADDLFEPERAELSKILTLIRTRERDIQK